MGIDWKKIGRYTAFTTALGYVGFSLLAFSYSTEGAMCNDCNITIEDSTTLRFVTKTEVYDFLNEAKMNPMGVRIENINLKAMEDMLESKSRIKSAECYMTPSGTMNIEIRQREPILRVMNRTSNYYVDSEGDLMQIAENFAAYVPVVTGQVSKKFAQTDLYEFAWYLKENKFWNCFFEQIDVNSKNELTLVPRVGNQTIILGSLDNYEVKLDNLMALYKKGFSKTGWSCYKTINLSYAGQVVCTKKD